MDAPQAIAKITPPKADALLPRERLFARIDQALVKHPVLWLSAPGGSGKTSLVAGYLAARRLRSLWYQVDERDADPVSFFHHLGLAAHRISPRSRKKLPPLTPEYLPGLPVFILRFFETLYQRLSPKRAAAGGNHAPLLVFDNFQDAPPDSVLADIVSRGLSVMPDGLRAIIISRAEPPAAFASLRARGRIALLGWEALRFDLAEATELAGDRIGGKPAPQLIERLHGLTDGWVAGLILFLEGLVAGGSGVPSGDGPAPQAVFDYFAGEVFAGLPEDVRRFLVRTAFLPDFTAAMAHAVSGVADVEHVLALLCRQHCFVERMGEQAEIYRYHDLFRDFLRTQAGEEAHDFRSLAARALAEAGRATDAIPLFLENGDGQAAVSLILAEAQPMIAQGRRQTLAGWIDALPPGMTETVPWLSFWRGVAELPVKPSAGRALIERAHGSFVVTGDTTGQMIAAATIMEAYFQEYADFSTLDRWFAVLESLGGMDADFPTLETELRVLTGMLVATCHRQPSNPLGRILVNRLETILEQNLDPNRRSAALAFMLWHTIWIGDFVQARRIHAAADRLLHEGRITPLNEIMLRSVKGHGEIILADGAGAQEVLDAALKTADHHGLTFVGTCLVLPMQICRHLQFGDLAAAESDLASAEKKPFPGQMSASQIAFCRCWLELLRGNIALADQHARDACEKAERSGSCVARSCTYAAWAIILAEGGDSTAAEHSLTEAQRSVEQCRTGLISFHLLLVEAWLALRGGDAARCHARLGKALAQGAAQGYMNTMQWLPAMMSELCAEALREGIETGYVRELIRKRGLAPPSPDIEIWPWPVQIHVLGSFSIFLEDQPLVFAGKVQKKPLELLKVLLASGGGGPVEQLVGILWPDADGDLAYKSLEMSVVRLRKLLGCPETILFQGGEVALNPRLVWTDLAAFDRLCREAETGWGAAPNEAAAKAEAALALYRGHCLPGEADSFWLLPVREGLRARFIELTSRLAAAAMSGGNYEQAAEHLHRGLAIDHLVEIFYQRLMVCHDRLGQRSRSVELYHQCARQLAAALGIEPSPKTRELYQALMAAR